MCYKQEKHKGLTVTLSEKLKEVPDFIADFFDRYKSAVTKNCNWGYIRDLLQWLIEKRYIEKDSISQITKEDMDKITCNHIIKYLDELNLGITGRKNSLDSICTKKNVFSALWSYMNYNEYVRKNIIMGIPRDKYKSESADDKEVFVPTDEQVEEFLCRLNDGNNNEFNIIRNLAIVKLIMGSGIRSEELINMDIGDLFLDGDRPYIKILGKGNKEHYTDVAINPSIIGYLKDYLVYREIYLRDNNVESDALFISNERKRMSKKAIASFFERYSNGVIFPHALRHWVGTKLYEQTNDIIKVQKQLRHKSLETAAKYYVHVSKDDVADAMANLF